MNIHGKYTTTTIIPHSKPCTPLLATNHHLKEVELSAPEKGTDTKVSLKKLKLDMCLVETHPVIKSQPKVILLLLQCLPLRDSKKGELGLLI
jgi:hypothetical protein